MLKLFYMGLLLTWAVHGAYCPLFTIVCAGNLKPFPENDPAQTDAVCFTYEELSDGTLRIVDYDETKNTQNPYQVTIPSTIDGKPVSTLGEECLGKDFTFDLLELTVSDGITTIEANITEHTINLSLIRLPDSVTDIDEKAFWKNDCQTSVAIACRDTSHAYQYAKENGFACQVLEYTLPENAFLDEYQNGPETKLPYFAHLKTEGEIFDYITMEYRDNEIEKRLQGELVYHEPNEFLVLVLDKDSGDIRQCLDSSHTAPEMISFSWLHNVNCQNFLSLRDWNFDGREDIVCYQGIFGTGAASFSSLFVCDADSGLYQYVPEFTGIDSPSLRADKQCIYGFSRGSAVSHYVYRYEYVDGRITEVACLSQLGLENDGVEITDERLTDGEWRIYCQKQFYPRDTAAKDPWRDAYDQARVLYVHDGYWDLYE